MTKRWPIAKLRDLTRKIGSGATPRGGDEVYKTSGVPLIRSMNVHFAGFKEEGLVYLDDQEAKKLDHVKVEANDVLLNITGASIGRVTTTPESMAGARVNQHVCIIRPNPELYTRFLAQFLASPDQQRKVMNVQVGVTRQALTKAMVLDWEIPLPPLDEQRQLVAEIEKQFSRLDEAVANLKRVKANLKRYKAAVLKAAVEGKLTEDWRKAHPDVEPASELLKRILAERRRNWEKIEIAKMKAIGKQPTNDSWKTAYKIPLSLDDQVPFQLPKSWEAVRAEQICHFITKGTTPKADKLFSGGGEIPYIKVYNLTHVGKLDFTVNPTFIDRETHNQELARSKVYPGDVLMNIVGPPLGKVSVVPDSYPEWNINQAITVFRPMPSYNPKLLRYFLMSEPLLTWSEHRAKATAGQFNLTLEICRDLPLPVPPADEQAILLAEIERAWSVGDEAGKVVDTNLVRVDRVRQSLLGKAFSGKPIAQN